MIKIHAGEIYQDVEDIFDIEVLVVGDHGEGKIIIVAVIIRRFVTMNRNPKIIELQIKEVDRSKYTMKLLRFIVKKVNLVIFLNNPSKDGKAVMKV